jgi:hypothetical protein
MDYGLSQAKTNPFSPVGRFSYTKIWRPDVDKGDGKKRWSTVLILEPDYNDQLLVQMFQLATQARQRHFPGAPAEGGGIRTPFRFGIADNGYNGGYNLQKYPEYANKLIVSFSSKEREIDVVDMYGQKMPVGDKRLYSGAYGRVSYNLFAYGHNDPQAKNRGISFGLCGIMVCADGEPLVARNDAVADFQSVAAKPADNSALFAGAGMPAAFGAPQTGGFPQQQQAGGLWTPQPQPVPMQQQPWQAAPAQQQWPGFTPQQAPAPAPQPFIQQPAQGYAQQPQMGGSPNLVFNPATGQWVPRNPLAGI